MNRGTSICLPSQSNLDTRLDTYCSAESLFSNLEHGKERGRDGDRERGGEKVCIQSRQHKKMLKPQPCELRMAETMCDPILSCPRYKNLASSRLAHDQRRRGKKGVEMEEEEEWRDAGWNPACSKENLLRENLAQPGWRALWAWEHKTSREVMTYEWLEYDVTLPKHTHTLYFLFPSQRLK